MKGILLATFGSSYPKTIEKSLNPLIEACRDISEHVEVAYTSKIIRGILKKRGENVLDVADAIKALASKGVDDIHVVTTFLIPGIEFEKLKVETRKYTEKFTFYTPLLGSAEEMTWLLETIMQEHELRDNEQILLMGHGTNHIANEFYMTLNTIAKEKKLPIIAATIEGELGLSDVKDHLSDRVFLLPLLYFSGDHAINDMVESKDSWFNQLKDTHDVRYSLKSLGEYPPIREHIIKKVAHEF